MAAETITVLFTDLVGSTDLLSRVGEARADELRREHFGLLRKAIEQAGGREVKNLGDGLMVVFGGVAAALDAAVAMQQAVTARSEESEPLSIKVGVAVGDAEVEDDDYFGLPVVEAARLCAKAQGGEILTTEFVRMLARSRSTVALEPVGALELKGLDEPVEVCAVVWEPLSEAEHAGMEVPLPARLTPSERAVFAGRSVELARFADAWKDVAAAERRVWLIGGEAGIGKTTLVSQLAARAHADGAVVLYGRCDEDLGVPYQPWIEALAALVAHAPEDLLAEHAAARSGELVRLVPGLAERTGVVVSAESDGEAERYALFGAVTDLLGRTARRLSVVLVLDDLHWADKPTVQLLCHLAGVAEPMRLMVVGTYRPSDIDAGHPLTEGFARLRREAGVEFVDLGGLDDVELLELMELTAGHEMPEEGVALRDAIAAETDGNPFFATEILIHLAESGAITRVEDRWVTTTDLAEHGLPVSVRQVIGQRVARLGPDAERVLRTAAVIGRDFDLGLLAEVAEVGEDDALDLLDTAITALLVDNVGPDRYSFAHALIEHTLYEDLTPSRRSRAHRRIAQALETRCGDDPGERIGELAHHWSAALVPEDAAKAVDYARQAGDRALIQLAPDEALRWYSQALELHERHDGDPHTRAALLVGLGDAQRQTGDPAHRDTLLRAAHQAQDLDATELLVAAALANHRGWNAVITLDREKGAVLEAALAAIGPTDTPERARLLAVLAVEALDPGPAQEAVAIARRLDDPPTLLAALIGHNTASFDTPLDSCVEAVTLAERLDDHVALAHASATLVTTALMAGKRDLFDRAIETCTTAAGRVGQPVLLWRSQLGPFLRATVDADLTSAETLAERFLADGLDCGAADAIAYYGGMLMSIRFHQGRAAELRPPFEQSFAEYPDIALFRAVLLAILVEEGDRDAARDGFERERPEDASADNFYVTYLSVMAWVCGRLGDRTRAATLLALLEPHTNQLETTSASTQFSTSACAGMLATLLGRDDDADRYFAEAIALATAFRHPFLVASAQLEWGRALLQRTPPDREHAKTLLDDTLATARRYGFGGIERDALALGTDPAP
jgi:class 3 adenylate cyclase